MLHDGRVVAERYAPGYGIDTPLLGWSMTKSVINALVGILVRQGRLSVAGPAPVPAWRDPSDPRHAITVEQLMRMTSGLALDETNTGFDPSSRMLSTEPDMAGFAESASLQAPPGTRYHYSSPSTLILSRIVRDAVGGRAEDVRRFAARELFAPLGMRGVTLEFDAAGTPVGSSYMYATARDWARFGLLYANDGVAGGRRILPEGWVGYSASPTPGSRDGYGAGFFTNRGRERVRTSPRARRHARRFLLRLGHPGPAHRHRPRRAAGRRPPRPLAGLGDLRHARADPARRRSERHPQRRSALKEPWARR